MNKYIEKAMLKIVQRMEQNRKEFVEAERSYQDTGYDRYFNKMNTLDSEYKELKEFLHSEPECAAAPETEIELDRLRMILKNVKSKVYYMEADFPANAHLMGLKELLREV
jgi:anion-transporting  ArsA/GET3 family ATPase